MSQDQTEGRQVTLTHFPALNTFFVGVVLLAVYYWGGQSVLDWYPEDLDNLYATPYNMIVPAVGGLFVLWGSRRVKTRISPGEKKVHRTTNWLFLLPLGGKEISFGDVRYVDFDHPSSGKLPESSGPPGTGDMYDLFHYDAHDWGVWSSCDGFGAFSRYRVFLFLEDRSRVLVTYGTNRDQTASTAQQIARMLGTRMG